MKEASRVGVTLHPNWSENTVESMDVCFDVDRPSVRKEAELCTRMDSTVGIPFCPMAGEIEFSDDRGPVPAECRREPAARSFIEASSYIALRDVTGDLHYHYRIVPREVPKDYTSSPYFDFRAEEGGANGAGLTFLMPPAGEEGEEIDLSLRWDLSDMPAGSRGVWSLGCGDIHRTTTLQDLKFSFYATGMLRSEEQDEFGLYWFGEPPFDMATVSKRIRMLFDHMARFFGDDRPTYRIFARRDPFEKSGGGTAAARSFMFGYNEKSFTTVESMQNLLSHEMVHNWPHIEDEPAGTSTWYNEGMAEYYSVVLPYRAGLSSLEDALAQVVSRAEKYYSNPTRFMSNAELAKVYWTDRRTQRVPYGRGFFYIANTDAAIRRATSGSRSVDDVVLEILRLRREEGEPDTETWLGLVSETLGRDARPEYERMVSGELVVPDPDAFGGAFVAEPATITFTDTEEEGQGFAWKIAEGKTQANTTM